MFDPAAPDTLPEPHGLLGPCSLDPMPLPRPMLTHRATCGFPSPAEDHMGEDLDLNSLCINNAPATFFVQAESTSMEGFGIQQGDVLVVDRSITAKHGDIAMVLWDGGYMIKKLSISSSAVRLISGSPDHPPILVPPETELVVWGVVVWSLTRHRRTNRTGNLRFA